MKPLPMPVRIAAGLVATAVEQVRDLPRLVVEFPVTAVSQALQASMRVQQKITELAIKGDRALGTLRPVADSPSWATFDDEPPATRNGASTVTPLRPPSRPADPMDDPIDGPQNEDPPASPAAAAAAAVTARAAAGETAGVETGDDSDSEAGGPNVLPGYADMTIPQLRARLRKLDVDGLRVLLAWETAHANRPPFVTMLGNRITTVTEG
ncbi:lipid droplet-associated protein [Pseudonocardia acidicola]|uniref:Lipid droplet-associated protein n=1 Tax=Pseudonocardia acidicola TaxID=2724939 RepID=A0ABX1SCM0_9PSEU|nr:lipid droplet-associated protein [Pseudonocardia acidicola]NMH98557.1 lipid droplet-associated protein [Pseudonocardia acidicola]